MNQRTRRAHPPAHSHAHPPPSREQLATLPIMRLDLTACSQCFNAVARALMLHVTALNMHTYTSPPPPTASHAQALAHSTRSASCARMPHPVHTGPSIRHCWLAGPSHVHARCVMQGFNMHMSAHSVTTQRWPCERTHFGARCACAGSSDRAQLHSPCKR